MKTLYTSPRVTVEELTKIDVLCASTEVSVPGSMPTTTSYDNANQKFSTLADFSNFM